MTTPNDDAPNDYDAQFAHPPAKPDTPAESLADRQAREVMNPKARSTKAEAGDQLYNAPAEPTGDAVERVARFITPTVLRYIPDYDEVSPEHVWTRPRYEWLTFAMIQIANAAIAALRDDQGQG